MNGLRSDERATSPWHVKTPEGFGVVDWSLPHDEGCPGCQIEHLKLELAKAQSALNIAGGDLLRVKRRIEEGDYGIAASIAHDAWYATAVAVPGLAAGATERTKE